MELCKMVKLKVLICSALRHNMCCLHIVSRMWVTGGISEKTCMNKI